MATMRPILSVLLLVLLATLAAPADAVKARQRGKLDQVQAAWASAVRTARNGRCPGWSSNATASCR